MYHSLWSGITLAFLFAWLVPMTQINGDSWFQVIIGSGLVGSGIGLRVWAIRTLGRFFCTVVVVQEDHQLVDEGPYRILRHPSYAGTLLSLIGIGLGLGNWLSVLVVVVIPLVGFVYRITREESALRDQFGPSYQAYVERTWRVAPFVW
jgi:protein-S-isoprenylcysteine O-methyltransferase